MRPWAGVCVCFVLCASVCVCDYVCVCTRVFECVLVPRACCFVFERACVCVCVCVRPPRRRAEQFEEDAFRARRELHTTVYTVKQPKRRGEADPAAYDPSVSFGTSDSTVHFGPSARLPPEGKGDDDVTIAMALWATAAQEAPTRVTLPPVQAEPREHKEMRALQASPSFRQLATVARMHKPPPPALTPLTPPLTPATHTPFGSPLNWRRTGTCRGRAWGRAGGRTLGARQVLYCIPAGGRKTSVGRCVWG